MMMNKFILSMIAVGCLCMPAAAAKKKAVKQENPFLAPYTTQYGIPPFEKSKSSTTFQLWKKASSNTTQRLMPL